MGWKCMFTLGMTLTSGYNLNLREIERVTNFYFFCPKSVQNATFENEFLAWLDKVKGVVFHEEKEKGRQTSCVSYVYMCFKSISAYTVL